MDEKEKREKKNTNVRTNSNSSLLRYDYREKDLMLIFVCLFAMAWFSGERVIVNEYNTPKQFQYRQKDFMTFAPLHA